MVFYNKLHYHKAKKMKILNYGTGAVGLGLSSCLIKTGEEVTLLGREETVASLKHQGLIRRGIVGEFRAEPKHFSCYSSLQELPQDPFDVILVTTKSFDSQTAAEDLSRHPSLFKKTTKIVLCQNGWGNAEIFTQFFAKKQIYNARVITGFTRPQTHEVVMTVHADSVRIGSLFGGELSIIKNLCQAISHGGLPCEVSKNIEKDLWAKLLYNCALNPLGAILDVPYGVLGEHEASRQLMDEIINEAFRVMQSAGYTTHWSTCDKYLKAFYTQFLPPTSEHRSSMLQDIKARRKTEIEALNGIIIKLAEQYGLMVPVNRSMFQMINFIEERNLERG